MEFRVLGSVEVRRDGQRVALSGAKLHTVLAALLLAREEVVSDERLCRLLWGWAPPATVSAQLYTYVSRLRKILGDGATIDRRPPGYAMHVGGATLDLREFERLSSEGRDALVAEEFEKAADLLRDALAQWNGQPFANASEYLADAEAPRLLEARAVALEHRVDADLALGRHQQITGELTGLVAEFPLRERIRCQLMTALCRSGRQADAIHLYHHGRAVLADELGVSPGEELQAAYRALLDGTLDRRPPSTAPRPAATRPPACL
ncbi:AfsR/SARP family transcriptional regulator, partial [Streptomyces sp. WAC04770]